MCKSIFLLMAAFDNIFALSYVENKNYITIELFKGLHFTTIFTLNCNLKEKLLN